MNEASPTFHHLLAINPLAFVAGFLGWMAIFVALLLLLPEMLALSFCIAVTGAHTAGACTWLVWRFEFGYQICNAMFLLASLALGAGIYWGWKARPVDEAMPRLTRLTRWLTIAALTAIAVYLFVLPRTP